MTLNVADFLFFQNGIGEHFLEVAQGDINLALSILHMSFEYQLSAEVRDKLSDETARCLAYLLRYGPAELKDAFYALRPDALMSVLARPTLLYVSSVEESLIFVFVLKWLRKNPQHVSRSADRSFRITFV